MDITIPNLKPGKHRLTLKYSDPFSQTDSSFSRALYFETPKAPPLISKSTYAPKINKQKTMKNVTKTYTDTVSHRQRTSNTVTLWTTTNHGLKKGDKITLTGMGASLNGTYVISRIPNAKMVQFIKKGTNFAKTADAGTISLSTTTSVIDYWKMNINLPEKDVKENLEWTDTLRDVVFFLYQIGSEGLKYVDSDIRNGGTTFTTTPPAYPSITKKRVSTSTVAGTGTYRFRYVIVRYYKDSSNNWVGYFPMLQKDSVQVSTINDIIVSAAGV